MPRFGRGTVVATALTAAVTAALSLGACGTDDNSGSAGGGMVPPKGSIACGPGSITGAGSTFQKNIELQWIKYYTAACPNAGVQYNGTGSGAGIQAFSDSQVDFAGSDSLLRSTEQPKADQRCGPGNTAIHLPVTAGAVVLTYNLPGITSLRLSAPVVAGIFEGTIKRWDDPRIVADNSGAGGIRLPALPIQAVHRSDSSGTTEIFSRFLAADAGVAWTLGFGKELRWPGGQAAKGSDGVTAGIKYAAGGITYTELSFAEVNSLPVAQVKGKGEFVDATGDSISRALASAKVDQSKGDLRVTIDYATTAPGAYPVSGVTYVIVCNRGNAKAASLRAYLGYATGTGQDAAPRLGYAKLPATIAGKVESAVRGLR